MAPHREDMTAPQISNNTLQTLDGPSMANRIIRYQDLIPCKNPFLHSSIPGIQTKENFSIIGPGVAENKTQFVHIREPHGFNIGAARQPPGCKSSQHAHKTAEVFMAHTGEWKIPLGPGGDDYSINMKPGDIMSCAPPIFRGFEITGDKTGFMYVIIDKDDAGKVTWAPNIYREANDHGLVLVKGGNLVDTNSGDKIPDNVELETAPSDDVLSELLKQFPSKEDIEKSVLRFDSIKFNPMSPLTSDGIKEAGIITPKTTGDGFVKNEGIALWYPVAFCLRLLSIETEAETQWHARYEKEVLFVQEGTMEVSWKINSSIEKTILKKGDTMTIPVNVMRKFKNVENPKCSVFITRSGSSPQMPDFE